MQPEEHFYHVLENTNISAKGRISPLDSKAPDLPPPFDPGTPLSEPPPLYQDITEFKTKP